MEFLKAKKRCDEGNPPGKKKRWASLSKIPSFFPFHVLLNCVQHAKKNYPPFLSKGVISFSSDDVGRVACEYARKASKSK